MIDYIYINIFVLSIISISSKNLGDGVIAELNRKFEQVVKPEGKDC